MNDQVHLHEGERLLCSAHSSGALLLRLLLRAVLDGVVFGALASALLFIGWWFSGLDPVALWVLLFCPIAAFAVSAVLRYRRWHESGMRVTTERILIETPTGAFGMFHATIKWSQYQESHVERATPLDVFFRSRSLDIRYGSADALRHAHVPSLRMATDLKHYLDKVDATLRQGKADELRPFVAKPRGERD
jgi:hypothetical protein